MSLWVSVKLPEKMVRALEELSKITERPRAFPVRRALESYLADYADYRIALRRLRNRQDVVTSGMREWLGLHRRSQPPRRQKVRIGTRGKN
jgi:predicted DNA-binding protein